MPRTNQATRALVIATFWVIANLLGAGHATALSIKGPTNVVVPGGCWTPVHYDIVGATGAASFNYWVDFPGHEARNTNMDQNGYMQSGFSRQTGAGFITATDSTGAQATLDITITYADRLWYLPAPTLGTQCGTSGHTDFAWQGRDQTYYEMETVPGHNDTGPLQLTQFADNDGFWIWCDSYVPFCNVMKTRMTIPHNLTDYFSILPLTTSDYSPQMPYTAVGPGYAFDASNPWRGISSNESVFPYPTPDAIYNDLASGPTGVPPRGLMFGSTSVGEVFGEIGIMRQMMQEAAMGPISGKEYPMINPECVNGNLGVYGRDRWACVQYDLDGNNWNCRGGGMNPCIDSVSNGYTRINWDLPATRYDVASAWTPTLARPGNAPAFDRTYAAPTTGQQQAIHELYANAGIRLESYPTVPMRVGDQSPATDGSYQIMPMLDGRNTLFCDVYTLVSSKLVAEAPYLLNGVYCGGQMSQGQRPAPAGALDPGVGTGPLGAMTPPAPPKPDTPSCPVGTAPSF